MSQDDITAAASAMGRRKTPKKRAAARANLQAWRDNKGYDDPEHKAKLRAAAIRGWEKRRAREREEKERGEG